jgi:hypothetical protein
MATNSHLAAAWGGGGGLCGWLISVLLEYVRARQGARASWLEDVMARQGQI